MSDNLSSKDVEPKRSKQGRSPAYPGIDLRAAIGKAKALYDAEGKYAAPMPSAFSAWGFGPKSSGAREVRAALKYFGLITIEGDGENGKVKLTDDALRVLLDEREDQTEKKAILRRLAVTPPIHKILLEQFPDGIKSDASVEHYLVFDHGYNKSAAGELVAEFKATAAYTELFKPSNISDKLIDIPPKPEAKADVGDLIQVEIDGALTSESPKRVRAIQDYNGKKWIFVDGSETGIPIEQVRLIEKAPTDSQSAAPLLPLPPVDPKLNLDQGEREWLRGPLSKETSYRLIVCGNPGPKEIGKLIKLLEAQKLVLSDEDETLD